MTDARTFPIASAGYPLPSLLAMAFIALLAWYGWRHRGVPGAMPFTVGCVVGVAWSLGSVFGSAAQDPGAKILWLRFTTVWELPLVTAATCFALQYAGLGRWLTRRVLVALTVPPLFFAAAILTDGLHHLAWASLTVVDGEVHPVYGPLITADLVYSYLLFAVNVVVLLWLFARSPRHRAPVALLLLAQIGARVAFQLGVVRLSFPAQWDPDLAVLLITFGAYAVALFGFHVLDPLPAARSAALATMQDAMVVVDVDGRIVDVNASAERALRRRRTDVLARRADEALPPGALAPASGQGDAAAIELVPGDDGEGRRYVVEATPLEDRRGQALGRLILLHDVTERLRAQARLLEQERVVATLQERERLARELHDSVGQVLGYLSLQAQTAGKRLRDGDAEKAQALLARLAAAAQRAHADVRESILALSAASSEGWAFLPTLGQYARDFQAQYGIETQLTVAAEVAEDAITPHAGVQLLRAIQEAMTNARRHGNAGRIGITVERRDGLACVTVADDGCGFDPSALAAGTDGHFGLGFMRERMAQIGGQATVDSHPGGGTRVYLTAPAGGGEEQES